MTVAKRQVLNLVRDFPEKIDIDDLMYRLYLLKKIEAGESDIRKGKTLSHQEALKKLSRKW